MSRFVEKLNEERSNIINAANDYDKNKALLDAKQAESRDLVMKGARRGRPNKEEQLINIALDTDYAKVSDELKDIQAKFDLSEKAKARVAEIDRMLNADTELENTVIVLKSAYQNQHDCILAKGNTATLVSNLQAQCRQAEEAIQTALAEHGKQQVKIMLAGGSQTQYPDGLGELQLTLEASKASLNAAQTELEAAIRRENAAESAAHQAYLDFIKQRFTLTELNYYEALEQALPEFADYMAMKALCTGKGIAEQLLTIDLGKEAIQEAGTLIMDEIEAITGRRGS